MGCRFSIRGGQSSLRTQDFSLSRDAAPELDWWGEKRDEIKDTVSAAKRNSKAKKKARP
jgi:hypothetical protein